MSKEALLRRQERRHLAVEAQVRIRNNLHTVQVGLNLLRNEMLSGDLRGADLTYATIQHCLRRLANDQVLATTRAAESAGNQSACGGPKG